MYACRAHDTLALSSRKGVPGYNRAKWVGDSQRELWLNQMSARHDHMVSTSPYAYCLDRQRIVRAYPSCQSHQDSSGFHMHASQANLRAQTKRTVANTRHHSAKPIWPAKGRQLRRPIPLILILLTAAFCFSRQGWLFRVPKGAGCAPYCRTWVNVMSARRTVTSTKSTIERSANHLWWLSIIYAHWQQCRHVHQKINVLLCMWKREHWRARIVERTKRGLSSV